MPKFFYFLSALLFSLSSLLAQKIDSPNPVGSQSFGSHVIDLPNGNFVVTDPYYDDGVLKDVGAVYLFNGVDYTLIATIKGSHVNDRVGHGGVMPLPNGNFLIKSNYWNNNTGALTWVNPETLTSSVVSEGNSLTGGSLNNIDMLPNGNFVISNYEWNGGRGAVTLGNEGTGISGAISDQNSLVGNNPADYVGKSITVLPNSNYIITSQMAEWRGAVTWADGSTGAFGHVSAGNSLVGVRPYDVVGSGGITILPNGNFLVSSPSWQDDTHSGAITWVSGASGVFGEISASNSLVGMRTLAQSAEIRILKNGNYLVSSVNWGSNPWAVTWGDGGVGVVGEVDQSNSLVGDPTTGYEVAVKIKTLNNGNYVLSCYTCLQGRGSVTFGNGISGVHGEITELNSLVGEVDGDYVGAGAVTELSNGNFVISSYRWNQERGAATWVNGQEGIVGKISADNSLIGTYAGDVVGIDGIVPFKNGNYVVTSIIWKNHTGAVTWGNGTFGISGEITAQNSFIGNEAWDRIGSSGVFELANGHFVICSGSYNDDQGAVTWVDGSIGGTGFINSDNSLVGSSDFTGFGLWGITALTNGNYLISSSNNQRGAVMWRNGSERTSGIADLSQTLRGDHPDDIVGYPVNNSVIALPNGNFVIVSSNWNNHRGAVTWGDGGAGLTGVVSSENSLIGSKEGDQVGYNNITILDGSNFLVTSTPWDQFRGALTWGSGKKGVTGVLSSENSLVGTTPFEDVGQGILSIAPDGNYVLVNDRWQGYKAAATLGNGSSPITGQLSSCNSLIGTQPIQSDQFNARYNAALGYLMVGRASENSVSIFKQENKDLAGENLQTETILSGNNNVPFISEVDCEIIASVKPAGSDPVNGSVTAKVWIESSIPTLGTKPFVARHYEITPDQNASNASGKITLYFNQEEFDDFNAHPESFANLPASPDDVIGKENLRISQYHGVSSDGTGLPSSFSSDEIVIDPEDRDILWNTEMHRWEVSFDVTGFSNFLIHTSVPSLPVTMIDFSGKLVESDVLLNWKTTMEVNSHEFEVQRSLDGKAFSKIGSVAAYNTLGMHNYNFGDSAVLALRVKNIYYRLKMIDVDGSFSYSNKVAVSVESNDVVIIYPNPSRNSLSIRLKGVKESSVEMRVFTPEGKLLGTKFFSVSPADNSAIIDMSGYPAGVYHLDIRSGQSTWGRRFVKM